MPQKFEFRVTGTVPDAEDRTRRWADFSQFLISASDQIQDRLAKTWPLIPWRIEAVTPTSEPPTVELKTGDGRFDPRKPVTVNGFRYIPAPASQSGKAPSAATVAAEPTTRVARPAPGFVDPMEGDCPLTARREGDEMICTAPGCGLRWAVGEERPGCPK